MARIVVVEDDDVIAALIVNRLQRAEHHVTHAGDGESGLDLISRDHPDLVVLDWTLPGMDGPQVCRAMRQDANLAHTLVLMLSARQDQADIDEALRAGVDTYLTKPFVTRELVTVIARMLTSQVLPAAPRA